MSGPDTTLPSEVRRTMKGLYERTQVMPVAIRNGMTTITLKHVNDRVRMTQRYVRPVGSKRWRWHSSSLWTATVVEIDGAEQVEWTERPIVNSMDHYVSVFLNTEDEFLGLKKIEFPPLEMIASGDEIPLGVVNILRKIEKHMGYGKSKSRAVVGTEGDRYVIQFSGPLATVRLYFEAHHEGSGTGRSYRADQNDPLRVVRHDGVDLTNEFLSSPELYAALMSGDASVVNTGIPQVPSTDTRGPRSNAVESRRATVMRI